MRYGAIKLVPGFVLATLLLGEELPPKLIKGLGADDFKERENSQRELLEWAKARNTPPVVGLLDLMRESDDPEVRQRCVEVLRDLSDADYLLGGNGFLGIVMDEVTTNVPGDDALRSAVLIKLIVENSPAHRAGLREGDLIVAVDGELWREPGALVRFRDSISGKKPLDKVVLAVVRRNGKVNEVKVVLGRNPIEDTPNAMGDLKQLDEMARERHFKEWLKRQKDHSD